MPFVNDTHLANDQSRDPKARTHIGWRLGAGYREFGRSKRPAEMRRGRQRRASFVQDS